MSWLERGLYLFGIIVLGVALYSMMTSNAELADKVPVTESVDS